MALGLALRIWVGSSRGVDGDKWSQGDVSWLTGESASCILHGHGCSWNWKERVDSKVIS